MDNVAVWSIGKNKLIGSRECEVRYDCEVCMSFTQMEGKKIILWPIDEHLELNLEETGLEYVWFVN